MDQTYRQYRAPREDNQALVDPRWSEQLRLVHGATRAEIELIGAPLSELASEARAGLLESAQRHTGGYINDLPSTDGPLILSGHQPQLFHAGVWFKNHALAALAGATGGVGVHLLIDSDLCREVAIRVPTGSIDRPRVEPVPFDAPLPDQPYEDRPLGNRTLFERFPKSVTNQLAPFVPDPMVGEFWEHARAAADRTDNLGLILSEARHRIEHDLGRRTLEVPFSRVCDTIPFRRFLLEIIGRAESFRDAYNRSLSEYRKAHKLRTDAQPLPDLRGDDDLVETPFWVWTEETPRRHPLYVHRRGEHIELTDRHALRERLPQSPEGALERLAGLREAGVKIRGRALATTLYCRFVLADLFLHGIGGAKYDQVTDRIAERFFGVAPPRHATLSATFRLPIEHNTPTAEEKRELIRRHREMEFHPETLLPGNDQAAEEKRRWINTPKTHANAAERHRAIVSANAEMLEALEQDRSELEARIAGAELSSRAAAVLDSREYAFCLFPLDNLRERIDRLTRIA